MDIMNPEVVLAHLKEVAATRELTQEERNIGRIAAKAFG